MSSKRCYISWAIVVLIPLMGAVYITLITYPTSTQVQVQTFDARQSVLPITIPGMGAGSGCVIGSTDRYWYIGTARHVVEDQISIIVDWQVAERVAVDTEHDIAILRIARTGQDYRVLDTGEIRLGQTVRAYGYHWRNGIFAPELMVMVGRVSCLDFDGFYTANGGLYPGNSGGPLLDESGKLLGIASRVPQVWGSPHFMMACFVPVSRLQELLAEVEY